MSYFHTEEKRISKHRRRDLTVWLRHHDSEDNMSDRSSNRTERYRWRFWLRIS